MIQFAKVRSFKDRYSRSFVGGGGSTFPVYWNIRLYPGLASFKATNPSASYFLCRLLSGQLTTVFYFVRIQSEESIKTRIIDGVIRHSKTAHLCSDYLIETFIPLFPFWVIVAQLKMIEWMNFSPGLQPTPPFRLRVHVVATRDIWNNVVVKLSWTLNLECSLFIMSSHNLISIHSFACFIEGNLVLLNSYMHSMHLWIIHNHLGIRNNTVNKCLYNDGLFVYLWLIFWDQTSNLNIL